MCRVPTRACPRRLLPWVNPQQGVETFRTVGEVAVRAPLVTPQNQRANSATKHHQQNGGAQCPASSSAAAPLRTYGFKYREERLPAGGSFDVRTTLRAHVHNRRGGCRMLHLPGGTCENAGYRSTQLSPTLQQAFSAYRG